MTGANSDIIELAYIDYSGQERSTVFPMITFAHWFDERCPDVSFTPLQRQAIEDMWFTDTDSRQTTAGLVEWSKFFKAWLNKNTVEKP